MDFIVVCPHCGAYIGVSEYTYTGTEFYLLGTKFMVNGELYCASCGESSILDVELEPCNYNISKEEE